MFVRWLLTVFPREMAQAWQMLRPALVVWLGLSAMLALLTSSVTTVTEAGPALLQAAVSLLVLVAMASMLERSATGRPLELGQLPGLYLRKAPALLGYGAIAFGLCLGARALTLTAVVMVVGGGDAGLLAGRILSWAVYLTLLVRFCFFPFLVVLGDRERFASALTSARPLAKPAAMLAWPLFMSDRLGEGRRWRLLPYVVLIYFVPALVWSAFAAQAGTLALAAAEMTAFMAYAVLFGYYRECVAGLLA